MKIAIELDARGLDLTVTNDTGERCYRYNGEIFAHLGIAEIVDRMLRAHDLDPNFEPDDVWVGTLLEGDDDITKATQLPQRKPAGFVKRPSGRPVVNDNYLD
jgi:hypothetical protein